MIHYTAIVDPNTKIGSGVEIGPYCIIGPNVELKDGVKLKSHVNIEGNTSIGNNTCIFPFASIGSQPQDLKYNGEESYLSIGNGNIIREYVTINTGTAGSEMNSTIVGDGCLFMIGAHVAHDCIVGNNVILANNATLGGHVVVGDFAILGGLAAVHQFVRIGCHSFIGGVSAVVKDVIPYGMVTGDRASLIGINVTGLKRRNFSKDDISAIKHVYDEIFLSNRSDLTFTERVELACRKYGNIKYVMEIIDFIKQCQFRSICCPKSFAKENLND